ncbi:hypothetical protein MBH78_17980 [Oceanimonas sp. NS1]|nr:hypothetical protein [Oceanimonas sp. NS1]
MVIKEGAAYMEQLAPRYAFSSDWSEQGVAQKDVLEALNLSADKLAQGLPIAVVNTGNRFVIVAVNGAQTLAHLARILRKSRRSAISWTSLVFMCLPQRPGSTRPTPLRACLRPGLPLRKSRQPAWRRGRWRVTSMMSLT